MGKKLKIGILTQPLHDNYGGLLQAYALKEVLQSLGHEVLIINRHGGHNSKLREIASKIKNKLIGGNVNPKAKLSIQEKALISQNTLAFRKKYIPNLSELITRDKDMKKLNNMGFDAYVVGSDQSWRPRYSPNIRNYFLDFAINEKNIKRLSYSVSFGVSDWEFNKEDTKLCASLAKRFDAISVREDSGVKLVNDYLDADAVHLVDPTMLLTTDHYIAITKQENIQKSKGNLKIYILDRTQEKQNLIDKVEKKLGLKQFQVMPNKRLQNDPVDNIHDFVYPSPAEWLKGYEDAKFVIADSFHGTLFAILFNIPFLAIGNKSRGMARFESLLKMFGLEDRLVADVTDINIDAILKQEVDWERVNMKVEQEKQKSLNFLKNNLK